MTVPGSTPGTPGSTAAGGEDVLARRYGRRHPWARPTLVAVTVLLAAAFGGWLAWVAWFHGTPEVRSSLVGYDVVGPHRTTATVAVVLRDDDVRARCKVRAYAADHVVVGELSFVVDGASHDGGRVVRSIRTEREASAVENIGCTAEGQSRPR